MAQFDRAGMGFLTFLRSQFGLADFRQWIHDFKQKMNYFVLPIIQGQFKIAFIISANCIGT